MKNLLFALVVLSSSHALAADTEIKIMGSKIPTVAIASTKSGAEVSKLLSTRNLNLSLGRLIVDDAVLGETGTGQIVKGSEKMLVDLNNGKIEISGLYKVGDSGEQDGDNSDTSVDEKAFVADLVKNGINLKYELSDCANVTVGPEVFVSCKTFNLSMSDSRGKDVSKMKPKSDNGNAQNLVLMSFGADNLSKKQIPQFSQAAGRVRVKFKSIDLESFRSLPDTTVKVLIKSGLLSEDPSLNEDFIVKGQSIE